MDNNNQDFSRPTSHKRPATVLSSMSSHSEQEACHLYGNGHVTWDHELHLPISPHTVPSTECSPLHSYADVVSGRNTERMGHTTELYQGDNCQLYRGILAKHHITYADSNASSQLHTPYTTEVLETLMPYLCYETLEPHIMMQGPEPTLHADGGQSSQYTTDAITECYHVGNHCRPSSPLDSSLQHDGRTFYESRLTPNSSESDYGILPPLYSVDTCMAADKPYARLIYDALMQAPGRKMMLRDIYDWFVRNTSKPRESGSNGWQNSIRHNLSMNQAFENDKNDASPKGHPRKANSVWILTEDAVKHGVQSTTRFRRKRLDGKKGALFRLPATERQKSGSKGGRAARRAATVRRHEEAWRDEYERHHLEPSPPLDQRLTQQLDLAGSPDEHMSLFSFRPDTPTNSDPYESTYRLPTPTCYATRDTAGLKLERELSTSSDMVQTNDYTTTTTSSADQFYYGLPELTYDQYEEETFFE